MFDGYLALGDIELINAARTTKYVQTLVPELPFVRVTSDYDTLAEALGDDPYVSPVVDGAVWVSPDDENSEDFYGLYPLSIEGIPDSTMSAGVTQGILNGGFVNSQRNSTRSIRVHGILLAKTEIALESGLTWLRNALPYRVPDCLVCRWSSLKYFLDKPPASDDITLLYPVERYFHRVKTTVSVSIIKHFDLNCDAAAYEVDFILTAENPFTYSPTLPTSTDALSLVGYFSDAVTNYLLYPNAEALTITPPVGADHYSVNWVDNPVFASGTDGWALLSGGGTATLTTAALTTIYGSRVGRAAWTALATTVGAGVYYDIPLGPVGGLGLSITFQVNYLNTNLSTRIGVSIDLIRLDTGAVYSAGTASEYVVTAGTPISPYIPTLVLSDPLGGVGTTSILARIKVVTVAGTGAANWTAGSQMDITGVRAEIGTSGSQTAPPSPYWTPETNYLTNLVGNPSGESTASGYTNIPGTTGVAAVTNPTSTTAYGTKVLRSTWSTASTAAGGGMYVQAAVTIGQIYSFQVNHVKASITTRLKLRISWYNGGAFVSDSDGAEFVATAGTIYSPKLENLTAPATATLARVTVLSVAGTSYANWSIASYLEMDGVIAVRDVAVSTYFDGNFSNTDTYNYSWFSTVNFSVSLRRAYNPTGWLDVIAGGTAAVSTTQRTTAQFHDGVASARTYWYKGPTDDADVNVGGSYVAGAVGTPFGAIAGSLPYYGSIWVRPSKNQRLRIVVNWLDNAGTVLGTMVGTATAVTGATWTRLSVTGTSHASATNASIYVQSTSGTGYTRWAGGDYIDIDSAMLQFGSTLSDYFDGNTTSVAPYAYQWNGTTNASSSSAVYVGNAVGVVEIIDPDLPVLAEPPALPVIPNDAVTLQNEWVRYAFTIASSLVPLWAGVATVLELQTATADVRQVRVRFYPNPDSDAVTDLVPDSFDSEFVLSYLPADSALTVDSVNQVAYASVAGGDLIPADQLLYGTNGGPTVWGEMTDGVPYVVTVDIVPTADITNLSLDLALARRE